jgi:hypothetical protein
MLDTGRMQGKVEPIPAVKVDHLTLAINIFKDYVTLSPPLVQDNTHLL